MPELIMIVDAARKQERDRQVFAAALKGIDLDKDQRNGEESLSPEERIERSKRRAEAQLRGLSEEEIEYGELGLGVEIE